MRRALLALTLAACGCGDNIPDACATFNATCIALVITAGPSAPSGIDGIEIVPVSGFTLGEQMPVRHAPSGQHILPAVVAIVPKTLTMTQLQIDVHGLAGNDIVADGVFTGSPQSGEHVQGNLELSPFVPGGPDMGVAPDLGGGGGSGGGGGGGGAAPDMGSVACDPVAQTSCGSGKKCTISGNNTVCVDTGNVATGAACVSSPDNCVAGDYCYGVGATQACEQFCNSDTDCTSSARPVSSQNTPHCHFAAGPSHACSQPCNPIPSLGASGCVTGTLKCDVSGLGNPVTEYTHCESTGAGVEGGNCTRDTDCAAGMGCFTNGTAMHCRYYCRMGNNADCTVGGETCLDVTNWTFIGACCVAATGC